MPAMNPRNGSQEWILKPDPVYPAQSIETHRSNRDQNPSRPGNGSKAIALLFTEAVRLSRSRPVSDR
jgi:hypothetical protein